MNSLTPPIASAPPQITQAVTLEALAATIQRTFAAKAAFVRVETRLATIRFRVDGCLDAIEQHISGLAEDVKTSPALITLRSASRSSESRHRTELSMEMHRQQRMDSVRLKVELSSRLDEALEDAKAGRVSQPYTSASALTIDALKPARGRTKNRPVR